MPWRGHKECCTALQRDRQGPTGAWIANLSKAVVSSLLCLCFGCCDEWVSTVCVSCHPLIVIAIWGLRAIFCALAMLALLRSTTTCKLMAQGLA
eukprot:1205243-Amphidinium_carterae.1